MAATFLPITNYGDIIYINVSAGSLQMTDDGYNRALKFKPGNKQQNIVSL